MFKDIISRDEGCPWGVTGLTSALWLDIPTEEVQIENLIATQPGVLLKSLIGVNTPSYSGDEFPHVISFEGKLYLEDGHHRVFRALLQGRSTIIARLYPM